MPLKMRLQRFGKKGQPFYHIVIADGRAPRDGKFIEKIGIYNPVTQPATIEIDIDGAVKWLKDGAQPTDTVKAILGYTGVLYKKHLLGGVLKGAFDMTEADKRFEAWKAEKDVKIQKAKSTIEEEKRNRKKEMKAAEAKINDERAQEILKRKAAELDAKVAAARAKAGHVEEVVATPEVEVETAETPETAE